jgi:hypothetical protein
MINSTHYFKLPEVLLVSTSLTATKNQQLKHTSF